MHRRSRSPLLLMALTVFIDLMGFGIILPLLPFWAEKLGANPFEVGLILTIYAVAQFLFTPLLGALSDRFGRRPVIIVSLLIEAASFALTALAGSLPVLLIARFIGGIGSSNIGSAQAVVADVTPPEGRARGMGLIGAAIGMGFVVGPAIGGVLAGRGQVVPFWAAMAVALVNALLVLLFLPETRKQRIAEVGASSEPERVQGGGLFGGWQRAFSSPMLARLIGINLLFTLAFTAMEAVFPLFTQQTFRWDATQNGYIFTYVGIVIVIVQGGLVGVLVKRFGERAVLIGGLALLAGGLLLLPVSQSLAVLLIALAILSAGDGAVTPTTSALLSLASPSHAQGETLGIAQGVAGLGRIFGPILAGALFSIGVGLPFAAGGVIVLLALLLALGRFPTRAHGSAQTHMSAPPGAEPVVADSTQVG
jgi:multidrug resistance protein